MSSTNIHKEFAEFGKRMNVIAILTLLSFIFGIIGAFIPPIGFIGLLLSVIIIIFFLMVLGNIKRAGRELNNNELLVFTPRFLWGTIIRFIGQTLWTVGWVSIEDLLRVGIILLVIGGILILVGCILRYKAWGGMQVFFEADTQLFPQDISLNGSKGSKLCKIATILDIFPFISFVGDILRIIGYFKLASTKDLIGAPAKPISQPAVTQPISTQEPPKSASFCPSCGSSVSSGARFCPECGSAIN